MESSELELEWFTRLQEKYFTIMQKFSKYSILHKQKASNADGSPDLLQLKIERMKLPVFDGNIRSYPQFKSDFKKFIMPRLSSKASAAYVLKS